MPSRHPTRRARTARTGIRVAGVPLATGLALSLMTTPAAAASTMVIAHRGDKQSAPENTNAAFRKAIAKGADAVEMDVRFSSTSYPMVLHDATLNRTTNCSGPINRKNRVQIARCDAGSWFSAAYRGERVPKLDVAMRTVARASPRTKVVLHIKVLPTTTQAKRVMNSVRMHHMRGRTVIIADTYSILRKMRSVGFTELGHVFASPRGWKGTAEYMLPYNLPLDRAAIAAIHRRGGKVWPVQSRALPLSSLVDAGAVDGIVVNHLGRVLDLL